MSFAAPSKEDTHMRAQVIEQFGSPQDIYDKPATMFLSAGNAIGF